MATTPPRDFDELRDLRELIQIGWTPARICRRLKISERSYYYKLKQLREHGAEPARPARGGAAMNGNTLTVMA
jgi:hypothetical protein